MALNTYPAVASPIKSVQRGSAGGAGTVTITAVNTAKSTVMVFGTASSGTVAATGAITGNVGGNIGSRVVGAPFYASNFFGGWARPISSSEEGQILTTTNNQSWYRDATGSLSGVLTSTNISGGATNLVAAVVQGYLNSSTELIVSGACRWEVVEYN